MIFERLYGARTPLQQRPSVISKPSIRREQIEFYHHRHYHALPPIRPERLAYPELAILALLGTISACAPTPAGCLIFAQLQIRAVSAGSRRAQTEGLAWRRNASALPNAAMVAY
jgi:hypothetical protein